MAIRICEAKRDASNLLVCQLESNEGKVKKKQQQPKKNHQTNPKANTQNWMGNLKIYQHLQKILQTTPWPVVFPAFNCMVESL